MFNLNIDLNLKLYELDIARTISGEEQKRSGHSTFPNSLILLVAPLLSIGGNDYPHQHREWQADLLRMYWVLHFNWLDYSTIVTPRDLSVLPSCVVEIQDHN